MGGGQPCYTTLRLFSLALSFWRQGERTRERERDEGDCAGGRLSLVPHPPSHLGQSIQFCVAGHVFFHMSFRPTTLLFFLFLRLGGRGWWLPRAGHPRGRCCAATATHHERGSRSPTRYCARQPNSHRPRSTCTCTCPSSHTHTHPHGLNRLPGSGERSECVD